MNINIFLILLITLMKLIVTQNLSNNINDILKREKKISVQNYQFHRKIKVDNIQHIHEEKRKA